MTAEDQLSPLGSRTDLGGSAALVTAVEKGQRRFGEDFLFYVDHVHSSAVVVVRFSGPTEIVPPSGLDVGLSVVTALAVTPLVVTGAVVAAAAEDGVVPVGVPVAVRVPDAPGLSLCRGLLGEVAVTKAVIVVLPCDPQHLHPVGCGLVGSAHVHQHPLGQVVPGLYQRVSLTGLHVSLLGLSSQ